MFNPDASLRDQIKEIGAQVTQLQDATKAVGPSVAEIQHAVDAQLAPLHERLDAVTEALNSIIATIG